MQGGGGEGAQGLGHWGIAGGGHESTGTFVRQMLAQPRVLKACGGLGLKQMVGGAGTMILGGRTTRASGTAG